MRRTAAVTALAMVGGYLSMAVTAEAEHGPSVEERPAAADLPQTIPAMEAGSLPGGRGAVAPAPDPSGGGYGVPDDAAYTREKA
ncbi:MAG: hypothetical protein M3R01_10895, partial [Actinomycetota bacterium]|nr:hypothetical protein [Actinomycetota bacterium]